MYFVFVVPNLSFRAFFGISGDESPEFDTSGDESLEFDVYVWIKAFDALEPTDDFDEFRADNGQCLEK